jgi:Small metal-binding protein
MVSLVGVISFLISDSAFSRGILGPQPGDRSPEQNERWLQTGVEEIQMAIQQVNEGNGDLSIEHAKAAMAAMKEISSEGWDGKRQRSVRALRYGISAARKGNLEKASLQYQDALKRLDDLKYGDMNFTHESFLGIGDGK